MKLNSMIRRLALLAATVCALLAPGGAWADKEPIRNVSVKADNHDTSASIVLSQEGRGAFEFLNGCVVFGGSAVGFAGEPSIGSLAYAVLRDEPSADRAFQYLLQHASVAGRLYALCGLWSERSEVADPEAKRLSGSSESVLVFQGCLLSSEAVSSIVGAKNSERFCIANGKLPRQLASVRKPTEGEIDWKAALNADQKYAR